ncbi:hypothetical protein JCM19240_2822 [Vibrio maritimus]|uniref:Uncharacterized protein n=1 Tax=Vibrio maritimus TaxID=990268 RepID=A0A090TBT4_9VIBR|nr:hypothetical protein JCM19240_2822 [Vibrio maritimus]
MEPIVFVISHNISNIDTASQYSQLNSRKDIHAIEQAILD